MKRLLHTTLLLLAAALLALAAYVGAAWAPDRPVSALQARWAPPPSQFAGVGGLEVHLRDEGPRDDPQPIVLLHGTSASLHTWEGWAQALSARHRVIRFDLPGFGLTGPNATNDYRMETYVAFVVAVLDHLGVARVTLGGNSLGGQIAWETALQHPDRVAALVLVDAAGYDFEAQSTPIGFTIAKIPVLREVMRVTLPRRMVASSVRDVYGDPTRVTDELIDRYYELTLRTGNRAALVARFRNRRPSEHADRIPTLQQPTLILWGDRDALIPPEWGQRFAEDLPNGRLVRFPELGHVPHEEDPAATVAAVQGFLER